MAEPQASPITDAELEAAIDRAAMVATHHPDRAERVAAFDRPRELVARRSPETVERMERERGLRG